MVDQGSSCSVLSTSTRKSGPMSKGFIQSCSVSLLSEGRKLGSRSLASTWLQRLRAALSLARLGADHFDASRVRSKSSSPHFHFFTILLQVRSYSFDCMEVEPLMVEIDGDKMNDEFSHCPWQRSRTCHCPIFRLWRPFYVRIAVRQISFLRSA